MQRWIAGIGQLWNRGCWGKALIGFLALLLVGICGAPFRGASRPVAPVPAATSAAVAAQPTEAPPATRQPVAQARPTEPPPATRPPRPTRTPEPSATNVPEPTESQATVEPIATAVPPPTSAPAQPQPTSVPVAVSGPTYRGTGSNQSVDPPWWPCKEGQVKGNQNSGIYHVPTGRSYAKTFKNVACFDTTAAAEAAGYRAAKN